MLPVAEINPAVLKLPPCMLPVTLKIPVGMLVCPVPFTFKLMLPLAEVLIHNSPMSTMLPVRLKLPAEVIVPVAEIMPAVSKLLPVILPVAVIFPVEKSPMVILPKISPFTYKLPPIPTPPATINAPVVELVLIVVATTLTVFV